MEYAEGIGLLENNIENTQEQLDALSGVAKKVGLLINVDNTKLMPKNIDPTPKIMFDGTALEVVYDFQYLGVSLRKKSPNTEFFFGSYFPVFGLNTVKYGPEETPHLDPFHTALN